MTSSKLKIDAWDIERVIPYEKNSKLHDPAQVAKIAESIKRFGWDQPIVVDAAGVIIKGHGRRLAAISLGLKTVPVLVRDDLTPDQVNASRLADNRAALGGIDAKLMAEELASLDNMDLLAGIFDEKELEFTMADLGEMNTDAFIPDVDAAVRAQGEETKVKVEENAARRVPLSKVFGFKDLPGKHEITVNRFMAFIEAKYGLKGDEALAAHMEAVAA